MISSSLFVLLLATYAYSIPVGDNLTFKNQVAQVTTSESVVLNLLDDGESKNAANIVETTSATMLKNGLPLTTQNSYVNNERVTRGMMESSKLDSTFETTSEPFESSSVSELVPRGIQDSFTTVDSIIESSTGSGLRTRGIKDPLTTSETLKSSSFSEVSPRGIQDPLTTSETLESSSFSELSPRGIQDSFTTSETLESSSFSELSPRGIEDSFTTVDSNIESSTGSKFRTREAGKLNPLYPTSFETADQFNSHAIRGENVKLDMDIQTTEEPLSSSVTSFATTTGLLRGTRGEQSEDLESSSMQMDDMTTDQSKTVIEVFAGPNTKAEIIPGKNTKTEVVPGENTKTEIISPSGDKIEVIKSSSNKLTGEQQQQQPLSEGKN